MEKEIHIYNLQDLRPKEKRMKKITNKTFNLHLQASTVVSFTRRVTAFKSCKNSQRQATKDKEAPAKKIYY
jgi:hypothetical protein